MEELFKVNLAVAIMIQTDHNLDQVVTVDMDAHIGQGFLPKNDVIMTHEKDKNRPVAQRRQSCHPHSCQIIRMPPETREFARLSDKCLPSWAHSRVFLVIFINF